MPTYCVKLLVKSDLSHQLFYWSVFSQTWVEPTHPDQVPDRELAANPELRWIVEAWRKELEPEEEKP